MRSLENSLEKMHFKCNEAENIIVNYQKLRGHLQVSETYATLGKSLLPLSVLCPMMWMESCVEFLMFETASDACPSSHGCI